MGKMKCQDSLLSAHLFFQFDTKIYHSLLYWPVHGLLALAAPRVFTVIQVPVVKSCFPLLRGPLQMQMQKVQNEFNHSYFLLSVRSPQSRIGFYQCRRHTASHALEIHSLAVSHQPTASSTVFGIVFSCFAHSNFLWFRVYVFHTFTRRRCNSWRPTVCVS